MIRGKLLHSYVRDAQHQYTVYNGVNGTKRPDHSRTGGCYALACPESCDIATVHSVRGIHMLNVHLHCTVKLFRLSDTVQTLRANGLLKKRNQKTPSHLSG